MNREASDQICPSRNVPVSGKQKVLCIDDDPDVTSAIQRRLNPDKFDVLCAYHGMHGFWLAMTEHPDLIITDVNMPQGAGDYVVECLKRNSETADIPVVVLSGVRDAQTKKRMRLLGVETYLTKPCELAELEAIVDSLSMKSVESAAVAGVAR